MKKWLFLLGLLAPLAAAGEGTNAPAPPKSVSFETLIARAAKQSPPVLQPLKPNEVMAGKYKLSGSIVEAVKTGKPAELLNPAAPPQFGSAEDNLVRNPANGKMSGLKLFAIQF
jgi:hypothetical protein